MIPPINSTNAYQSSGLEPVKVPHFCGKTSAKLVNKAKEQKDTVSFTNQAKSAAKNAKKGAVKTYIIIKDGCGKGFDFTKSFIKSLYEDASGIAKKHYKKKITRADGIADLLA